MITLYDTYCPSYDYLGEVGVANEVPRELLIMVVFHMVWEDMNYIQ